MNIPSPIIFRKFLIFGVAALGLGLPAMAKIHGSLPRGLTVVDWKQIRAEYERHRHGMFPDGGGFKARSFEQQWLAHFDGRGFLLEPDQAHWRWGLELAGVTGKARVTTDVNRVTYQWSADLEEWFLNDTRGLEHGFTLKAPREIRLGVRGGLRPRAAGAGVEFVDASSTARIRYSGLAAWDANGRGVPARMKVEGESVTLAVEDRGARYPITIDPIVQQAYVKASNTGADDFFGLVVAVSGDTVVVGAWAEDSNATGVNGNQADNSQVFSGAAYVFVRSGGTWTQEAYLKASNTGAGDQFGYSVAVSGDTVVVGAWAERSNATGVSGNQADNTAATSGAAYVFVRSGATWTQQAYLKASNTGAGDQFGQSVAVSGDTVVAGATGEDSNATGVDGNQADNSASFSGAAYVFVQPNVTITSSPAGLIFSTSGAGCAPGAGYVTPTTLAWTPGASCSVTFGTPQTDPGGVPVIFYQWEDNSTNPTRAITAPSFSTTYTATFVLADVAVSNLITQLSDPGLGLTGGQVNSLTDKPQNALASIEAGQNKQAVNQLNAFIKSVESSLKTGKMSAQAGDTLINAANAIIAIL